MLTSQREAASALDAKADAEAAAASEAAIEAERARLAAERQREQATSYQKPHGNTPEERRESGL